MQDYVVVEFEPARSMAVYSGHESVGGVVVLCVIASRFQPVRSFQCVR